MSNRRKPDDPRRLDGGMAGPGGPHDIGGVVLDARNAIILDSVDVSTIDPERGARGQHALALVLGGRINQTQDRASVLFVFGTDGAAAICSELIALYGRATGNAPEFFDDVMNRVEKLGRDGNMS